MSKKEKELAELSKIQSEVEKLIKKYNHIASVGGHHSRIGLAAASDDYYLDEMGIDGKNYKDLLDFTNAVGAGSYLTIDGSQPDWFPSSFC